MWATIFSAYTTAGGGVGTGRAGQSQHVTRARALSAHVDSRGDVTLECARLLQSSSEQPVELFQIIGQDSYQNAVCKSNGSVLNKLLKPPRSLIVTPREEQSGEGGNSRPAIVVPPQHSSRVFVLGDYKDEMVSFPPTVPPSTPTLSFTLRLLQVLSSTSIRNMLAQVQLHCTI